MEPNNFVGQEIQGYKISKPIGQGKFSTVYKAENSNGQPFAVKKIKVFQYGLRSST
jgi:RIO-like serine/threonine protein kinase